MSKTSFPSKAGVLIVGAGPAGSIAAYELARLGIDVTIIDKAKFPRGKTCAGGVNIRTLHLLPFDLSSIVEEVITGISFTQNLEEPFLRRYPEPLTVTVRRDIFDHFLVQQAQQAGAHFFDGTQFLSLLEKNESVQVETSYGTFLARFVLGADGSNSAAAFILPLRRKRGPIQKGRCLLLGGAAGLINPFTGEGLYSAIRSAQIAARVLAQTLKDEGQSLPAYQEAVDRELMPHLECSRLFREIFNLRPSFFHQKIARSDRWWNAMAQVLRGEKTFLDVKNKLGFLGTLLLQFAK
ncbi:MAG: FAD-dependent monooxygenase [Deltaproteobacteria bacterium]|nr:FAD-dependent monooxygenase [Deltaproteobacteria bacterium]